MTTFEAGDFTLERIREHVWELPRTGDMRVPGRVYASEALLAEIAQDNTLTQLRNSAHLPGIQNFAICMPDGHQGYGFPVGGVGAMDAADGCISPGAVGYDINCLPAETDVLLEFGRRRSIGELRDGFEDERAIVSADGPIASDIALFTESEPKPLYEVTTTTGDTVRATADHPFRTPDGMVALRELERGDTVFLRPFDGMPSEEPDEFVVLSADDFAEEPQHIVSSLRQKDLLPLQTTDDAFNRLLQLVGFHTGAGAFRGRETWFAGEQGNLEAIREDLAAIGFGSSRAEPPETAGHTPERTAKGLTVRDPALQPLLVRLGAPAETPVASDVRTPTYLDRLPRWQRALYLSAFFGAAMTGPTADPEGALSSPTISQTWRAAGAAVGQQFIREIADHLARLDIDTGDVEHGEIASRGAGGPRRRLGIKDDPENLLRLFTRVGYRYHRAKQKQAALATTYLKIHHRASDRGGAVGQAEAMADGGTPTAGIRHQPSGSRPRFGAFCEDTDVRGDLTVGVEVESITPAGEGAVYDIGVRHDAHNFLANGFVVSNCGVRMVRTNLTYPDLRGREAELVDALFEQIPTGLGGGGVVETDAATVEEILSRGVPWAVEAGYGVESDLRRCEDEGSRPEADPAAVSDRAKDRGRNQIGSLGSGNHFLEVQRVTDVFREAVAREFGLHEDQIVILIHCGSRGLGHQVCTDYLREIEQTHQSLLSSLPDKELAAAPAGSELASRYYDAMGAAINFAWVNRQLVMHRTREVFSDVFQTPWEDLDMELLYDVAHNIAKKEVHEVDGKPRELFVHRKGATRALPAGREEIPTVYRDVGQPVIIPGSMGTGSYVLRGGERSLELSFGSTAHGAGRLMSRTRAKNEYWGGDVQDELEAQQDIYVRAQSGATVAEEAPGVYKDVDEVVRVSDALGIGEKVARTFPVCNIKG